MCYRNVMEMVTVMDEVCKGDYFGIGYIGYFWNGAGVGCGGIWPLPHAHKCPIPCIYAVKYTHHNYTFWGIRLIC